MHNKKRKKHTARNVCLIIVLLLVVVGAAFGITRYRSIKNSADSSFAPSGVTKQRDVQSGLNNKKPISILLMGIDTDDWVRNYDGDTNSMMIVTLNPNTNKTTITSIPHDLALKEIPGSDIKKPTMIGTAYSVKGTETTIPSVEKLLNIPIDYYALINMLGISKAINKVGGVEVTPKADFSADGYSFKSGENTHMDGEKVMAYVRSHQGDEVDRQARQRQVLTGLVSKSKKVSTLFDQDLIDSVTEQIKTDLTFDRMKTLAKNYRSVGNKITNDSIDGTEAKVDGQKMTTVDEPELQRVTDSIRDNLGLHDKDTGDIQYVFKLVPKVEK
ncbi:LCP family protein [Companilactobacillus zhongbaensis]|uniref:LCP family protein n=1 Tax=Companilactobacillus zhongbaensis TaxID=2486009 RepID=UPI000F7B45EF|nr:LCP family protein [Companilactobacillus zhongbaensis]